MNPRRILSQVALVAGTLLFSVGLQTFAAGTWSAPTAPPPNANADAPLNTGIQAQEKAGGLLLNTGGAVNGLIVQSGNVGIGVLNPTKKLDIAGDITASGNITAAGNINTTGDICTSANGGLCLKSVAAAAVGPSVYKQAAGCSLAGAVTTAQTCTTPVSSYIYALNDGSESTGVGYTTFDCAGNAVGSSGGGYSCLNSALGTLVAGGGLDNTVTVKHPSGTEGISCGMNVAGMPITLYANYDPSTDRYAVAGPWIATVLDIGGSAQGCYSGGCGEAQTNMSIGNSVSTSQARNSSGGITTTITHQVYMSGSFWLSNGRGSGSCSQNFNS